MMTIYKMRIKQMKKLSLDNGLRVKYRHRHQKWLSSNPPFQYYQAGTLFFAAQKAAKNEKQKEKYINLQIARMLREQTEFMKAV